MARYRIDYAFGLLHHDRLTPLCKMNSQLRIRSIVDPSKVFKPHRATSPLLPRTDSDNCTNQCLWTTYINALALHWITQQTIKIVIAVPLPAISMKLDISKGATTQPLKKWRVFYVTCTKNDAMFNLQLA